MEGSGQRLDYVSQLNTFDLFTDTYGVLNNPYICICSYQGYKNPVFYSKYMIRPVN